MQKEIFIFLGPPGSGKGTLAQLCVEKLSWVQLSTGNLCRSHIAGQTEIGKEIDFAIKSGKLVSDELITRIVEKWFYSQVENHFPVIFDGYPRTLVQAQAFFDFLKNEFPAVQVHVVRFMVLDDVLIKRLANRYVCKNKSCQAVYSLASKDSDLAPKNDMICDRCGETLVRRSDDEERTIKERLVIYHKHESALVEFFKRAGKDIVEINAAKSLKQVFEDFAKKFSLDVNFHDND